MGRMSAAVIVGMGRSRSPHHPIGLSQFLYCLSCNITEPFLPIR
ncbi:MAG: hypothetical protein VKK04_03580 [Synechococcales bacterium]|nr:hypothetical protein [Synechococcales bacterium]